MRKQQIKIIEKAKKHGFVDSQIMLLSREDLTIQELQEVYRYFSCNSKDIEKDLLALEAEKCVSFLQENKGSITSYDYGRLLDDFLPYKDTLLSNKKKFRIFKMYRFLSNYARKNDEHFNYNFLSSYVFMLYHNFPVWHMNTLLRPILKGTSHGTGYNLLFLYYPCLMDEFLYNGKESILYYLAVERNIIGIFKPLEKTLENLYCPESHCFCFKKDEFDDYFITKTYNSGVRYVENETYLTQRNLKIYPLVNLVRDFCVECGMKTSGNPEAIFTTWQTWQLEDSSESTRLIECYHLLGRGFTTNLNAYSFSVKISSNYFISVSFNKYKSIYVGADNDNGWRVDRLYSIRKFMISPDGRLFKEIGKTNKFYPLSLKGFLEMYCEQNICGDFMSLLLEFHRSKNVFYNDVISDCMKAPCLIPLAFNEVAEYHNRAELLLNKYKLATNVHIKWNKQNLNLSYLIIKAYPLVEPGISRRILLQQRDLKLVQRGDYTGPNKNKPYKFLEALLHQNVKELELKKFTQEKIEEIKEKYREEVVKELQTDILTDEYETWISERVEEEMAIHDIGIIVKDYVSMCMQSKIKVRLDIRSVRQLENLHGRIATDASGYRKKTGTVKVPKKSKFLPLREMLPPEFEWITTRKRLILETELQHHCVWSYADSITKDICAIYSFTDTRAEYTKDGVPRRYTIEFRMNKDGSYYVEQVQGKYGSVNANGMKEYIQTLLTKYSELKKTS